MKDESVKRGWNQLTLKLAGKVALITGTLAFDKDIGLGLRNELR